MIRNKEGKYSRGGQSPVFIDVCKAKIWTSIGSLKNHLNQIMYQHKAIPIEWKIMTASILLEEFISAKELYEDDYIERFNKQEKQDQTDYLTEITKQIKELQILKKEISNGKE